MNAQTKQPVGLLEVFLDLQSTLQKVIVSRTGSQAVAQDLTQDIYFKVQNLAETFPSYDDARHYLLRIAINSSIDHVRTEARRQQLLHGSYDLFENHMVDSEPEHQVIIKDQIKAIDHALSALPDKCKEILYLSRMEGLTHAEIAARMNISQSLVEKYIVKALLHCRSQLQSE
ncbi:RNA polymerase sigma factor [Acinetobacter larvae]|uniref:RNA polymerase subunit sigma-70 n=1 Tax=Acinetobacter larvae TaxID=1789224 RepID=A0A1B2M0C5_9GAMM|nr:RNA polymerase sigma factor [Acinetobacter larvae]AOA58619.1 RNA polymerase subunit sigma-70 [Acinetobacter larvae]